MAQPSPVSSTLQPQSSHPNTSVQVAKSRTAPPNPLAPIGPAALKRQATTTITTAYKPQYTDLNQQAKDAKNLDAKRASDQKYYDNWLAQQTAALEATNNQANQLLDQAYKSVQQKYMPQTPTIPQPTAQDAATNAGLMANVAATGQESLATSEMGGLAKASQSTGELGSVIENTFAAQGANRQKQISALDDTLQNLGNARAKVNANKSADIAKEISRLQGVEINKAVAEQNYNAAAEKLGLTKIMDKSLITSRANASIIAQQNANTAETRAEQTKMFSDRTYNLNVKKLGDAEAKDIYERQHQVGPYRVTPIKGAKPLMTTTQQRATYKTIDDAKGIIGDIIKNGYDANKNKLTPQQAYHLAESGGTYYIPGPPTTKYPNGAPKSVSVRQLANPTYLNVAYNLANQGYINPRDLEALNNLGLFGVRKTYPVKHEIVNNPALRAIEGLF